MKRLSITLTIILMGCSWFSNGIHPHQNTLEINNRSGGVVRIFADDGFRYNLGRAWPGKNCMLPRIVSSRSIVFGIQHLAQNEVWMQDALIIVPGRAWKMEINQPQMAVFDMIGVVPVGERCK